MGRRRRPDTASSDVVDTAETTRRDQAAPTSVPRHAWIAVLVVGLGLFEAVRHTLISTDNPNFVPALILLGAGVAPATFVAFIQSRRLSYGLTTGTVAMIAVVGGVVGVVAAGTLEYRTLRGLGVLPMVAVGVIEEAAKLIAPLVVLLVARQRRLADGLLAGVASGAGFAALETMGYAFVTLIQSRGNIASVDGILLLRGILSPAAHMAWTGLTATALWYAASTRWRGSALLTFLGVYVVAVALHTTWDSVGRLPSYAVLSAVSLLLLTGAAHQLHVAEVRGEQPGLPGRSARSARRRAPAG